MNATLAPIENPKNGHGLKGAALFGETRKDRDIFYCMDEVNLKRRLVRDM